MVGIFETLDDRRHEAPDRSFPSSPHLILVLECDRLDGGGARYALGKTKEVRIGRGTERAAIRAHDGSLSITVPDGRLSTKHARLVLVGEHWQLEDVGSRNGVYVGGERVAQRRLEDDDVVELGHTIFLFRAAVPTPPTAPERVDMANLDPRVGLRSLVPSAVDAFASLLRVAGTDIAVVLQGETGTGKELLARVLHDARKRSGPLVAVNCAALPETLFESQLFGHVKGAFTGATRDEPGFVRAAEGGTLFLDEIGELAPTAQAKLLRVLQEREVVPVGTTRAVKVDFRLITATHRSLDELVERGAYRADLVARIAGYVHQLPALRDRREDLGVLAADILRTRQLRLLLTPDVARRLVSYPWPHNVRELDKTLARLAALAPDGVVELAHLPDAIRAEVSPMPASTDEESASIKSRRSREDPGLKDELEGALSTHAGNIAAVARALGCAPAQVRRWIAHFGLVVDDFRRD